MFQWLFKYFFCITPPPPCEPGPLKIKIPSRSRWEKREQLPMYQ